MVSYRFENDSYSLAFVSPALSAVSGRQVTVINTFQPSVNLEDSARFVAGWLQVVNDENTFQTGILSLYDQQGALMESINVNIDARKRVDIDLHRIGAFQIGLAVWSPTSSQAKFRIRQNRYFHGEQGLSDIADVLSIPTVSYTHLTLPTIYSV